MLLHDLGHDPAEVMSTLPALEARGGHIQPARLTGAPAGCRPDRVTAPGTHRPVSPGLQPSRGRQPGSRITARDKWRGKAGAISADLGDCVVESGHLGDRTDQGVLIAVVWRCRPRVGLDLAAGAVSALSPMAPLTASLARRMPATSRG